MSKNKRKETTQPEAFIVEYEEDGYIQVLPARKVRAEPGELVVSANYCGRRWYSAYILDYGTSEYCRERKIFLSKKPNQKSRKLYLTDNVDDKEGDERDSSPIRPLSPPLSYEDFRDLLHEEEEIENINPNNICVQDMYRTVHNNIDITKEENQYKNKNLQANRNTTTLETLTNAKTPSMQPTPKKDLETLGDKEYLQQNEPGHDPNQVKDAESIPFQDILNATETLRGDEGLKLNEPEHAPTAVNDTVSMPSLHTQNYGMAVNSDIWLKSCDIKKFCYADDIHLDGLYLPIQFHVTKTVGDHESLKLNVPEHVINAVSDTVSMSSLYTQNYGMAVYYDILLTSCDIKVSVYADDIGLIGLYLPIHFNIHQLLLSYLWDSGLQLKVPKKFV